MTEHALTSSTPAGVNEHSACAREDEGRQEWRSSERRVYRLSTLPKELKAAIGAARMDPSHDHLNDVLTDQQSES